jgi:hypothetical protein
MVIYGIAFLAAFSIFYALNSSHTSPASPSTATSESLDAQVMTAFVENQRLQEIFLLVGKDPNQPTKQIHDEFWSLLLKSVHADPAILETVLMNAQVNSKPYEKEFWDSMRLSALNHRVIMTSGLEEWDASTPKLKSTEGGAARQRAMLSAAAEGKPFFGFDGRSAILTEKVIQENNDYLQSKIDRQNKLFDPKW